MDIRTILHIYAPPAIVAVLFILAGILRWTKRPARRRPDNGTRDTFGESMLELFQAGKPPARTAVVTDEYAAAVRRGDDAAAAAISLAWNTAGQPMSAGRVTR